MLPKTQDHPDKLLRHWVRRIALHELANCSNRRIALTVGRRRLRGWRLPIAKLPHCLTESLAKVARKWGRWCLGHWLPLPGAAARPPNR
jgi:hypothetical protein